MAVSGVNSTTYGDTNVFSNATSGKSAEKQQIDFLSMLMVQLKNQNPSQPYDNQEFAAQLATFSQLEQLTDIKTLLTDQADVIGMMAMSMENTALPGIIGKYASASSDTLDFDGINATECAYKVTIPGATGQAKIYDSAGNLVKTLDLDPAKCKVGEQSFQWNGKDEAGNTLLPAKYKVKVELTETDGTINNPETYTVGKVEAVRFKSTGTVVVVNGTEVPLSAIADVRETSV